MNDSLPGVSIMDDTDFVKRRTEDSRVSNFTTETTANARLVYVRYRIVPERIGILLERERRTSIQPDARFVAGADLRINAELRRLDAASRLQLGSDLWLRTPLAFELALTARNNHF